MYLGNKTNVGDIVDISFEHPFSSNMAKETHDYSYHIVAKGTLGDCIGAAREKGYQPGLFRQTIQDGSDAHLRLTNKNVIGFARIISYQSEENSIEYILLFPHE